MLDFQLQSGAESGGQMECRENGQVRYIACIADAHSRIWRWYGLGISRLFASKSFLCIGDLRQGK